MPVRCQRCPAIAPTVTDLRDAGWQEMTCVASCFDGEDTWLCPTCVQALRTSGNQPRPDAGPVTRA